MGEPAALSEERQEDEQLSKEDLKSLEESRESDSISDASGSIPDEPKAATAGGIADAVNGSVQGDASRVRPMTDAMDLVEPEEEAVEASAAEAAEVSAVPEGMDVVKPEQLEASAAASPGAHEPVAGRAAGEDESPAAQLDASEETSGSLPPLDALPAPPAPAASPASPASPASSSEASGERDGSRDGSGMRRSATGEASTDGAAAAADGVGGLNLEHDVSDGGMLPSEMESAYIGAQRLLISGADCLLCRATAALARTASHPHAPPFSAPVDLDVFPDYAAKVKQPLDLRSVAERLSRGLYGFGTDGELPEGMQRFKRDVELIWKNCRAYNPPRSTILRMLIGLEAEFAAAWATWVERREGGWQPWLRHAAAALVPLPRGARLPPLSALAPPRAPPPQRRDYAVAPPPTMSAEEVAKLSFEDKQQLLEAALPGRAPPPPGWAQADVGGCPWHKNPKYLTPEAEEARLKSESALVAALDGKDKSKVTDKKPHSSRSMRVVTAAIGRRVRVDGTGDRGKGTFLAGLYQPDGRILTDKSHKKLSPTEFCIEGQNKNKRPLNDIFLEGYPEQTLEQLIEVQGFTWGSDSTSANFDPQADPHCVVCGGGESVAGNEILLCDGLDCSASYHQRCCDPHVAEVPEGAWLCPRCVEAGNVVDPQVIEDMRRAEEARGGEEQVVVVVNDGSAPADLELLTEMLDVIDSSLPLIGRANAAKVLFSPDHQSVIMVRVSDKSRRVCGGIVLKPHVERCFLEIAFCVVRKEEQRGGLGTRLIQNLKDHALSLGVLHLLTYADDSATGFFERLGFDADPAQGMHINRFHWGISHYIGSQLRQCVLDPDGATLYPYSYPKKLPKGGRRLPPTASEAASEAEAKGTGVVAPVADTVPELKSELVLEQLTADAPAPDAPAAVATTLITPSLDA